jgi:hypothetical protein
MAGARRPAPREQIAAARSPERIDESRADKVAEIAWAQWHQANPEIASSSDFITGFKKGFADYLQGTSDGQPPSVPPACYDDSARESMVGRKAVQDWFRGFSEGATQARASGLRPDALAARHTSLPVEAPPPVRRVHQVVSAEVLVLPAIFISTSGITWGENEEFNTSPRHPPL